MTPGSGRGQNAESSNLLSRGTPMARSDTGGRRRLPILTFFVLAFAWSWVWWWTAAATGVAVTQPPGLLLYLLGVFGPLVAAIVVAYRGRHVYRREFLCRIWDPRGISARWWVALIAVAVGPAALAALGTSVIGQAGTAPVLSASGVAALVGSALVAGLVEEPGWRGAVSEAWQARTRPVFAATGIGVLWSLWHLPLSFLEGSYYHELGAGSARFWLTHLMVVLLGILLVWLVNGSGGSILLAILAHAGFNAAIGLTPSSTVRDMMALLALAAATSAVVIMTRGRLRFQERNPANGQSGRQLENSHSRLGPHRRGDAHPDRTREDPLR
jgi:membrane protease YdiL (CAAX protease family)